MSIQTAPLIAVNRFSTGHKLADDSPQFLLGTSFFIPSASFPPKARGWSGFDYLVPALALSLWVILFTSMSEQRTAAGSGAKEA